MNDQPKPINGTCDSCISALTKALRIYRPGAQFVKKGKKIRVKDICDNLVPNVKLKDFKYDFQKGSGCELKDKFLAPHSSSALAVNCFAPFKSKIADLALPGAYGFESLKFEQKCPTGLKGTPPHLDVVLKGSGHIWGIESKLTEILDTRPQNLAVRTIQKARMHGAIANTSRRCSACGKCLKTIPGWMPRS